MKQFLLRLFCVIVLLMPTQLMGQAVSMLSHVVMPDSIERTLIREYVYPATISYIETQQGHYFALNDGVGTLTSVRIDDHITVNDFRVDNGYVYFCGKGDLNRGIFGDFSIADFFYLNQQYRAVQVPLNSMTGNVLVLNKLVTYIEGDRRIIAAIGETDHGLYCMAEIMYVSGTNVVNYKVGELSAAYGQNLMDIIATDNYVVTAGFGDYNMHVLRVHEKSDVLAPLGLQDSMVFFSGLNYDTTQLVMTHIDQDYFAMAAIWKPYYSNPGIYYNEGISVMAFNIPYTGQSAYFFGAADYQQVGSTNQWKLKGLTKPRVAIEPFYLLMETDDFGTASPITKIMEFGYYLIISNDALFEELYSSASLLGIDGHNGNTQYISNGFDLQDRKRLVFCLGRNQAIGLYTPNNGCLPYKFEKPNTQYIMVRRPILYPFTTTPVIVAPLEINTGYDRKSMSVHIDCDY